MLDDHIYLPGSILPTGETLPGGPQAGVSIDDSFKVNVDYYLAGKTPTVTFTFAATDADGNHLDFYLGDAPDNASIAYSGNTATITWHADAATCPPGFYDFHVTVTDGVGNATANGATPLSDDMVFQVRTTDTTADHTPKLNTGVTLPDGFDNAHTHPWLALNSDTAPVYLHFTEGHISYATHDGVIPTDAQVKFVITATTPGGNDNLSFTWADAPHPSDAALHDNGDGTALITWTATQDTFNTLSPAFRVKVTNHDNAALFDEHTYFVDSDRRFGSFAQDASFIAPTDGTMNSIPIGNVWDNTTFYGAYDTYLGGNPAYADSFPLHQIHVVEGHGPQHGTLVWQNDGQYTVNITTDVNGVVTITSIDGRFCYVPDDPSNPQADSFQYYLTTDLFPGTPDAIHVESNVATVKFNFTQGSVASVAPAATVVTGDNGNISKLVFHIHLDRANGFDASVKVAYRITRDPNADGSDANVGEDVANQYPQQGFVEFADDQTDATVEVQVSELMRAKGATFHLELLADNNNLQSAVVDPKSRIATGTIQSNGTIVIVVDLSEEQTLPREAEALSLTSDQWQKLSQDRAVWTESFSHLRGPAASENSYAALLNRVTIAEKSLEIVKRHVDALDDAAYLGEKAYFRAVETAYRSYDQYIYELENVEKVKAQFTNDSTILLGYDFNLLDRAYRLPKTVPNFPAQPTKAQLDNLLATGADTIRGLQAVSNRLDFVYGALQTSQIVLATGLAFSVGALWAPVLAANVGGVLFGAGAIGAYNTRRDHGDNFAIAAVGAVKDLTGISDIQMSFNGTIPGPGRQSR